MNTLSDFYRQKAWRELRSRLMLERVVNGDLLCEYCNKPIINPSQCIAHHKIPLTINNVDDWNISMNPENLSLVHISCHNDIHEKFAGSFTQKVYVIYGAPCSGKTTFVKKNMRRGDLVLDLDSLWQVLTYGDRYDKPASIQPVVFSVKKNILESIRMRLGSWRTAWIIGCLPFSRDRETLSRQVDGEEIFISSTEIECIENLEKDKERIKIQTEWKEYIKKWFIDFQE